jgi:hypothetical protein
VRTAGLGVRVDESVVEGYPSIPGPWSSFRTDSPAETHAVMSDHSVKWEGLPRPSGSGSDPSERQTLPNQLPNTLGKSDPLAFGGPA